MGEVYLADVVHPADVGMADLPRQSDFAVKEIQSLRVLSEILRQKLQRNGVPELQIVGAVDFAHPTCSDERDDSIPLGDFRSW